jgi:NTP pyrophosphatase (non-canonical NTP hydrolase)
MYTEERRKIYKKAMEAWGFEAQARVLQEECAELIVAVSHLFRDRENGMKELAEELADTYIMVGQMIEYLGSDVIEHIVNCKLNNVKRKLDKKEMADGD